MSRPGKSKQIFWFIGKKNTKVALRLPWNWHVISSSRIQRKFFWIWSVCLSRTSTVTSDFNHPSEDYINYISRALSAEMMCTQNNDQNSGRSGRYWASNIVPTPIQFSPVNTPGRVDCIMKWRFSATWVFLAFIW